MSDKGKKINLLVIEDDPSHFEAIRRTLETHPQFQLIWQSSLQAANKFLKLVTPDIVLCDLKLPDGEGIKILHSFDGETPFPVVFLSANKDERAMIHSIKAGAVDFLTKDPSTYKRLPFILASVYYRWQIEEVQKAKEKEYQAQLLISKKIFDHIHEGLLLVDENWGVQSVNPHLYALFDLRAEEIQSGCPLGALDSPFAARLISILSDLIKFSYPTTTIFEFNQKDIELYLVPIFDKNETKKYLLIFHDISAHQVRNRLVRFMLNLATYDGSPINYFRYAEQEIRRLISFDCLFFGKIDENGALVENLYGSDALRCILDAPSLVEPLKNLAQELQPLLINLSDWKDARLQEELCPGIESILMVPLGKAYRCNFFALAKKGASQFSLEDLHFMEDFARQIAMTFERLWLREREKEQRKTAEALLEIISMVSESLEIEEIVRRARFNLQNYIQFSHSQIWIIKRPEFESSEILQYYEDQTLYRLELRKFPLLNRIYQKASNDITAAHRNDLTLADRRFLPEAESYLFLPVFLERDFAVVMMLAFDRQEELISEKTPLFSAFAIQIAHLIRNAEALKEHQEMAIKDELTGLYNRRGLNLLAQREFASAKRQRYPLSVCFCDIDRFKNFNDHYSYQTGDRVLQMVAAIIKSQIRESDLAARYGGDEFIIFFPNTYKDQAWVAAERIAECVANTPVSYQGIKLTVNLTFGVSQIDPTDSSWTAAAARAAGEMQVHKQHE